MDLLLSTADHDALHNAMQGKIEEAIKEPECLELLMQRPSTDEASPRSYDLSKILAEIDNFDFVKKLRLGSMERMRGSSL